MKGVELFFPTYLKENRGADPMWASVAYTPLLAFGVLGQWIGGKMGSTTGTKKSHSCDNGGHLHKPAFVIVYTNICCWHAHFHFSLRSILLCSSASTKRPHRFVSPI